MRQALRTTLIMATLALALVACGQRGALYFPGESTQPNVPEPPVDTAPASGTTPVDDEDADDAR